MIDLDVFLLNIANAFDLDDELSLSLEVEFTSIQGWDSLSLVSIIAMLNYTYSVSITDEEFRMCTTLGDLHKIVTAKA